jgi:G:T/U-mismatch repair DNA glycosylase
LKCFWRDIGKVFFKPRSFVGQVTQKLLDEPDVKLTQDSGALRL